MKKIVLLSLLITFSLAKALASNNRKYTFADTSEYATNITFSSGYKVGDYVEFLRVNPVSAAASGYYQISISYTRDGVAAGATHIASISHSNPAMWRETGRINNNPYVGIATNFTVDCNTEYANPRFRIRAVNQHGSQNAELPIYIKVTSINVNASYTPLNILGNDTSVSKFLPMTSDWDLYVGDVFKTDGALLAIKAIQNGNVGIGTAIPDEKLTVKGKIHTQEVRVDMAGALVPDYVFKEDYNLKSLQEVEQYIKENKHLPEIPSAQEIEKNGLMLAEMNMALLKKMEEMTLYMIEMKKENDEIKKENEKQNNEIELLKKQQNLIKK